MPAVPGSAAAVPAALFCFAPSASSRSVARVRSRSSSPSFSGQALSYIPPGRAAEIPGAAPGTAANPSLYRSPVLTTLDPCLGRTLCFRVPSLAQPHGSLADCHRAGNCVQIPVQVLVLAETHRGVRPSRLVLVPHCLVRLPTLREAAGQNLLCAHHVGRAASRRLGQHPPFGSCPRVARHRVPA